MGETYCPNCGALGGSRMRQRGSFLTEVGLWLFFVIPGIVYSLWRLSTKERVCAICGHPGVIPSDSPRARQELGAAKRK